MATIKTSSSIVTSLPNPTVKGHKLTAVNSATIVNNDMYVLKSCGSSSDNTLYPICLYKITNFETNPKATLIKIKDSNNKELGGLCRHSNGIAFAKNENNNSGTLFVATMNTVDQYQVIQLSLTGVLKKKLMYKKNGGNAPLYSIDYVGLENGNKKFIVGVGNYTYDYCVLKGNSLEFTGISFKAAMDETEGWVSNDITYKSGKLYTTFFKKNSEGVIAYNKIFVYKAPKSGTNSVVNPTDIITSNKPAKFDKKYEIEGFCIKGSKWYAACNCNSTNKTYNKDHVVKLTKK